MSSEQKKPVSVPVWVKPQSEENSPEALQEALPEEVGGPNGLEPTRYGDWERNGRCVDF